MHEPKSQLAIQCLTALLQDIENIVGEDLSRDKSYVQVRFDAEGIRPVLELLQKHKDILTHYASFGSLPRPLAVRKNHELPAFLYPLWAELVTTQSDSRRLTAFSCLTQVFSLLAKSDLLLVDSDPFCRSFVERNSQVPTWASLPYAAKQMVDIMARRFSDEFGDLTDYRVCAAFNKQHTHSAATSSGFLKPHVSTGATFSKTPILDRCEAIPSGLPYDLTACLGAESLRSESVQRVNRMTAVPKDWRKPRLVFVEEAQRMFVQQSLRLWLEERARKILWNRLRFRDQEFQRKSLSLAGRSSIDLSDATDWLSIGVIWRFLRYSPRLRSALFAVRSSVAEVAKGKGPAQKSERVTLRCYGTMGNATTFTVVSIFLTYLTRYVEKETLLYLRKGDAQATLGAQSTVFGDDVVCDDVVAGGVIQAMVSVGLRPNRTKTFIARAFKESCGLDLFQGSSVTPLRLKSFDVVSNEGQNAWLTYSNVAHSLGYWKLGSLARDSIPMSLPVNSGPASLFSFCQGENVKGAVYHCDTQSYVSPLIRSDTEKVVRRDNIAQLRYALAHGSRLSAPVKAHR